MSHQHEFQCVCGDRIILPQFPCPCGGCNGTIAPREYRCDCGEVSDLRGYRCECGEVVGAPWGRNRSANPCTGVAKTRKPASEGRL